MKHEGLLPCSQDLAPILSQINVVHSIPSYLSKIQLLRLGLPSGPFPSDFPANNLLAFLFFHTVTKLSLAILFYTDFLHSTCKSHIRIS
jgi:hypothetical protein